jgi:hypothetical protein
MMGVGCWFSKNYHIKILLKLQRSLLHDNVVRLNARHDQIDAQRHLGQWHPVFRGQKVIHQTTVTVVTGVNDEARREDENGKVASRQNFRARIQACEGDDEADRCIQAESHDDIFNLRGNMSNPLAPRNNYGKSPRGKSSFVLTFSLKIESFSSQSRICAKNIPVKNGRIHK